MQQNHETPILLSHEKNMTHVSVVSRVSPYNISSWNPVSENFTFFLLWLNDRFRQVKTNQSLSAKHCTA